MNASHSCEPVIRAAIVFDVPHLLAMINELAEYERLSHNVTATAADLEQSLFGANPAAQAIIAECDGQPAGYAVFFRYFSTFRGRPGMYLEDIFVRPALRGRGVGERLFRRVASIALEQDCTRMKWSVLDWNELAIGFYHRLGAKPEEKGWTLYGLDIEALKRIAHGHPLTV